MDELPFQLKKRHKSDTISRWKKRGLKENSETILEIYEGSIRTSNCELCGNPFKSLRDRQMEHCHETGKFRNIVCIKCNACKSDRKLRINNTGHRYISKKKSKKGFYFQIQIYRNGKHVLYKTAKTIEKAIEIRDKFIAENPNLFT